MHNNWGTIVICWSIRNNLHNHQNCLFVCVSHLQWYNREPSNTKVMSLTHFYQCIALNVSQFGQKCLQGLVLYPIHLANIYEMRQSKLMSTKWFHHDLHKVRFFLKTRSWDIKFPWLKKQSIKFLAEKKWNGLKKTKNLQTKCRFQDLTGCGGSCA